MSNNFTSEIAAASAKVAPSMALVGATVFGFSLSEIAAIVGIVFVLAQSAHLAWRWRNEYVDRKASKAFVDTMELPPE